jgi:hypothetical protein
MAHLPVNHAGRPFFRVLAGVISLYILAFGSYGFLATRGESFFARGDTWVLGLQTNPAFSILSIVAGAVLLFGTVYGRNLDHFIYLVGSVVFLVAGLVMLTLLHTGANLLNFAVANCAGSFLIGMALLLAGLYGKVGSRELAEAEDRLRHGERTAGEPDPQRPAATGSAGSAGTGGPPDGTARSRPG